VPRTRTYGLDIDTIRYAQRVKSGSGTTILPEPLKQINKFVVGVKKLGLWNSMVSWPMRSIHNAGTGSTVYSLGGRGVFNGTMVNGPVWGQNGILVQSTTSSSVDVANFPISDLNAGPNLIAYFTPRAISPTITSEHFSIRYQNNDFFHYGHRGVGGLGSITSSFRSNDGFAYNSGFGSTSNFIGQSNSYACTNRTLFIATPLATITAGNPVSNITSRTSPATLSITSRTGTVESLVEFLVFFQNYNTIANRLTIQNIFNRSLRSQTVYA
jgi:hypothetical protein